MALDHLFSPQRFNQKVDFSGLRFGNMMPTDVDALFEMKGSSVLFYEFKTAGKDLSAGQERTFTTLVDDLWKQGKNACLIVCDHYTNPDEIINSGKTIVRAAYHEGEWHNATKIISAREYTWRFFRKELIAAYGRESYEEMRQA